MENDKGSNIERATALVDLPAPDTVDGAYERHVAFHKLWSTTPRDASYVKREWMRLDERLSHGLTNQHGPNWVLRATNFKPSDVILSSPIPLVDTFDKSEIEIAVAFVVHALVETGDRWRPIAWPELRKVLDDDYAQSRQPWRSLATNPFLKPGFAATVAAGFMRQEGAGDDTGTLELTGAALDRLVSRKKVNLGKR